MRTIGCMAAWVWGQAAVMCHQLSRPTASRLSSSTAWSQAWRSVALWMAGSYQNQQMHRKASRVTPGAVAQWTARRGRLGAVLAGWRRAARIVSRHRAGRPWTRAGPGLANMIRLGTEATTSICWTMRALKYCVERWPSGEMNATASSARPARKRSRARVEVGSVVWPGAGDGRGNRRQPRK